MELAIRSGMELSLDGPVLADVSARLADAKQSLRYAEDGLRSLKYEPRATSGMIDAAYQSVAVWTDRVKALEAEYWTVILQETAIVKADDDGFDELPTPDVSGTVRRRDLLSPKSPFEKDDIRAERLISLAVVEGCRVLRQRQTGRIYVTSGSKSNRTYQVDVNAGRCNCIGWKRSKPCKHLLLAQWSLVHALPHVA